MSNFPIIKFFERDIWNKRLSNYKSKLLLESGSENLISFAIIETPHVAIGISYEEDSVYPKVKSLDSVNECFIGVDNRLFIVNTVEMKVISEIDLQSFFVDVVELANKGIIVIEEIGVGLYESTGGRIWFTPTDLIENYLVENDTIIVTTDTGKIKLSILTGKELIWCFISALSPGSNRLSIV